MELNKEKHENELLQKEYDELKESSKDVYDKLEKELEVWKGKYNQLRSEHQQDQDESLRSSEEKDQKLE